MDGAGSPQLLHVGVGFARLAVQLFTDVRVSLGSQLFTATQLNMSAINIGYVRYRGSLHSQNPFVSKDSINKSVYEYILQYNRVGPKLGKLCPPSAVDILATPTVRLFLRCKKKAAARHERQKARLFSMAVTSDSVCALVHANASTSNQQLTYVA